MLNVSVDGLVCGCCYSLDFGSASFGCVASGGVGKVEIPAERGAYVNSVKQPSK